jgi:hypothetical protein
VTSTASWSQPREPAFYGAVLDDVIEQAGYRVVEAPTPRRERGRGKTDTLDAVLAARSTLVVPMAMLRSRFAEAGARVRPSGP